MLDVPDTPSIAVLPFVNMSGDAGQEYFSDGMTEDIITDLAKLSGLCVSARHASFLYKGKAVRPEQVSRELGVRYVLAGSVRQAHHRVRISAQLVDATSGSPLWADRYDRDLQDSFAVQDEITKLIVTAVAVKLREGEHTRVGRASTRDLQASDSYWRGRECQALTGDEANAQVRQLFDTALRLDPQFAVAAADLGWSCLKGWVLEWSQDAETLEQAAAQAEGKKEMRLSPQHSPAALRQRLPYQDQTVRERVLRAARKHRWGELTPRTPRSFPAGSPTARTLNGRPQVSDRQDHVLAPDHQSESERAIQQRGPGGRELLGGEFDRPKAACGVLEGVLDLPRGFRRNIRALRCSQTWGAVVLSATSILRRCVATVLCLRSPCPSTPLC